MPCFVVHFGICMYNGLSSFIFILVKCVPPWIDCGLSKDNKLKSNSLFGLYNSIKNLIDNIDTIKTH